ncbi:MAG: Crp/Fnr family transcriptional regulator [Tumebacillaceae bacterium]
MKSLELLRSVEFFSELPDLEVQAIGEKLIERNVNRGEFVFMEGEDREYVYFVLRGLIKVFKVDEEGRELIVNILGAGQMFPHVGLFEYAPYPGTAEALVQSSMLAMRVEDFVALADSNPIVMRKLMKVLEKKIKHLQKKLHELALLNSQERVEALLCHFAEEYGERSADGILLRLPVTHSEMAQMIGIRRESVNRVWNQLRKDGVLRGDKDVWVVATDWFEKIST